MAAKNSGKMRRLAEGVYERDGQKVVKWWEPDGKGGGSRKQVTLPAGTTLAEAKTFKGEMEREKARGRRQADQSIASFAERWTEIHPRPAANTNRNNKERIAKFSDDYGTRTLRSITRYEAQVWAVENPSRLKSVRAMFSDAVRDGFADENPFIGVKIPGKSHGRKGIAMVTAAELERLQQIARERWPGYGELLAGMIAAAAWTGMRPGELFALRPGDIDFNNREIHAHSQWHPQDGRKSPKWESGRTIPLLDEAADAFKSVPRHQSVDLVFYTQRGSAFGGRSLHLYWDPIRTAFWSGLPDSRRAKDDEEAQRERKIAPGMDFYELRHYFGSYLANELGATPYEIAKAMGHKDGGRLAQQLYIHTEEKDANERILERARLAALRREEIRKAV